MPGIAASWGSHFIFLDADDHPLPRAIEAGLAQLDAHPECGFVVGPHEEMTYDGAPVPWQVPGRRPAATSITRCCASSGTSSRRPRRCSGATTVLTVTGFQDPGVRTTWTSTCVWQSIRRVVLPVARGHPVPALQRQLVTRR